MFILKGYGKSVNYRMGVPLLEDVFQSMEQAIMAKEGSLVSYFSSVYFISFSSCHILLMKLVIILCIDEPFSVNHILNLSCPQIPPAKTAHGNLHISLCVCTHTYSASADNPLAF